MKRRLCLVTFLIKGRKGREERVERRMSRKGGKGEEEIVMRRKERRRVGNGKSME